MYHVSVLKRVLKSILLGIFVIAALPLAAAAGFGRWEVVYTFFAQACALIPGIVGDYLRIGFYKLTLSHCSLASRVSFGSFFAHPEAELGANVYIGCRCIIGKATIGGKTQIASGVQILSGGRQHARNEAGEISGSAEGVFTRVTIGAHCWIGAGAIVMADVGAGTTVGAGSVVSRPIPPDSVAVGSPARVIRTAGGEG
jgi:acetyltransferase-like isoleucine patch superfamily enzyme